MDKMLEFPWGIYPQICLSWIKHVYELQSIAGQELKDFKTYSDQPFK